MMQLTVFTSVIDSGKNDVKRKEITVTLLVKLRLADRVTLDQVVPIHLSCPVVAKAGEYANVVDRTSM